MFGNISNFIAKHCTKVILLLVITAPWWVVWFVNDIVFRVPSTDNTILAERRALVQTSDDELYLLKYSEDGQSIREHIPGSPSTEYANVLRWGTGSLLTIKASSAILGVRSAVSVLSTGAVVYANTNEGKTEYRIWKYEDGETKLLRTYPTIDLMQFWADYREKKAVITPNITNATSNTHESPFVVFPDDSIGFLDYGIVKGDGENITQTALRLRVVDVYGENDYITTLIESEDTGTRYSFEEIERGRVNISSSIGGSVWTTFVYRFPQEGISEIIRNQHISNQYLILYAPIYISQDAKQVSFLGSYREENGEVYPENIRPVVMTCDTHRNFSCHVEPLSDNLIYDGDQMSVWWGDNEEFALLDPSGSSLLDISDPFYYTWGECKPQSGLSVIHIPFCIAYSRNALRLGEENKTKTVFAFDEIVLKEPLRRLQLTSLSQTNDMAVVRVVQDIGSRRYEKPQPEIASTYAYDIASDTWALLTDNPNEKVLYLR